MSNPNRTTIRCRVSSRFVITVAVVAVVAGAGVETRTTYGVELRALDGRFALAVEVEGQGAALALARKLGAEPADEALVGAGLHLAGADAALARVLARRVR